MNSKRVGGLGFLVLSLLYGFAATDIPSLPIDEVEAMNARSLPFFLSGLGVLLSLVLVAFPGTERPADDAEGTGSGGGWWTVGLLLAGIVLYALALDALGFLVSTAAFLAAGFMILGERRWRVILLVPAVLVATLWLILVPGLGIYLAPGRVFLAAGGFIGA